VTLLSPSAVSWDYWLLFIIQLATLGVLIIYVWKTWEMASATRRAAEASEHTLREASQARLDEVAPAILVYFDSTPFLGAEIVIENAGKGAASDVSLHFDPPLRSTQPHETDQFFDAVQSLIPPGYRIAQLFDTWPTLLESDLPKEYMVTVRYCGVQNRQVYEVVHRLDAEAVRHRMVGHRKGLNEIAGELEKLSTIMERQLQSVQKSVARAAVFGYEARGARDHREAVQRLTGFWELQRAVKDHREVVLPYNRVLETLRADLVSVFRLAPWSELTADQREALSHAARALFDINAEVIGHAEEWRDEVDQMLERVAAAFD
jgi:hypothetical protein